MPCLECFSQTAAMCRWQGDAYHQSIEELAKGEILMIADYIENFSTFSRVELQQDYYNKEQVSIFIVMLIRHRMEGEVEQNVEVKRTCPNACSHHNFV